MSLAQLGALAACAARELIWGLRAVRREVTVWRSRAGAIDDPLDRAEALAALADKRPLLDGAALFWVLPRQRRPDLVRVLVAFQILVNFHDRAGERATTIGQPQRGERIGTLAHALDPGRCLPSAYRECAYLEALALTCRHGSTALTPAARLLLITTARQASAMDLEHGLEGRDRGALLLRFAQVEWGERDDLSWWELTAGSSALLAAIAILALGAEEADQHELERVADLYLAVSTVSTLLDHYIDRDADRASGAHNYFTYYADDATGVRRLAELIDRTLRDAGRLRRGLRHRVVIAAMVAMYLTSESARRDAMRDSTAELLRASGSLTRLLVPILWTWRTVVGERDA